MQKSTDSDDLSDEGELTVKMENDMSPEYSIHEDHDDEDEEDEDTGSQNQNGGQNGEDAVDATGDYDRRLKRLKEVSARKEAAKAKRRRCGETEVVTSRGDISQQASEDYNKARHSVKGLNAKKHRKGTVTSASAAINTPADSTQTVTIAATSPAVAANQAPAVVVQQGPQHLQQYYQLTDEIRDSLDLLEPKNPEFYNGEFNQGEYNEAKPLADLLINHNLAGYTQDGVTFSQNQLNTSQMIAQAYSHAQQMVSAPVFSQVVSSSLPTQVTGNMNVTVVTSNHNQDVTASSQQQAIDVRSQQLQTQMTPQQVQSYAEAYAAQVSADSVVQQQGGQVVTFSLAGGQNMIIASPHGQQTGQNYVIHSSGGQPGQNILIAAPGQQAMTGNFIMKAEGDELGHNIVLTQQGLGQNIMLTQDGQLTTAGTESVVLTTADGQQRHIQATRQIQPSHQNHQQLLAQGIPLQEGGAHMPQVSLVLPQVNSLFPHIQAAAPTATINPQALLQLCAKIDRAITMVKESQNVLFEVSRRVERIENHVFPQQATMSSSTVQQAKQFIKINKPKPFMPGTSTPTPTSSASPGVTKATLKAALSSYLTISEYSATEELKRSDSNSDLFIPVGTMSMVAGQGLMEAGSPGETPETASSTVQELPAEHDLMPVVLSNLGSQAGTPVPTSDINVPIVDSQSGIAVTVYDEGNENQKFQLGPGSSKEPNARFANTTGTPKTVILDPRFWEILVEDFQKNMSSDQLISAISAIRKPLVRSIGTSEISICSTVLKEAESACQGRRERLAKELVFRIFTLGEVYDRNVSGVFYINGKKMENKNKALDPAKMAAIHYLVMKYPPSVVDNPRLERLVWKNCVDRINDALRRIYNWIHKIVDVNNIMDKIPTDSIMMH